MYPLRPSRLRWSVLRKGFTLAEVLITGLILGIIMAMLFGVIKLAMTYWNKTNVRVQAEQNARTAMEAMANDFRQSNGATSGAGLLTPSTGQTITVNSTQSPGTTFLSFTVPHYSAGAGNDSFGTSFDPSQTAAYDTIQYQLQLLNPTPNPKGLTAIALVRTNTTTNKSGTVAQTLADLTQPIHSDMQITVVGLASNQIQIDVGTVEIQAGGKQNNDTFREQVVQDGKTGHTAGVVDSGGGIPVAYELQSQVTSFAPTP